MLDLASSEEAWTGTTYLVQRSRADRREGDVEVTVQGSKNCFNHLSAISMAGDDLHVQLDNTPRITDRDVVVNMLATCGLAVSQSQGESLTVVGRPESGVIEDRVGRRLRVTICHAAALAANLGRSRCPVPGGDAFTRRPIDLHLSVLKAAGAGYDLSADGRSLLLHFHTRPIAFDLSLLGPHGPSMGASVTALLVAAQARGVSILRDLSPEPEVTAVTTVLRMLDVKIEELGAGMLSVRGNAGPLDGHVRLAVPPDRTEAATYMLIGSLTQDRTIISGIAVSDLSSGLLAAFEDTGISVRDEPARRSPAVCARATSPLSAARLRTRPHPGFPTDVQPQMSALLTQANGTSSMDERIYAARTTHVAELAALGLRISCKGSTQIIPGRQRVSAGSAVVQDIRCGAALLVAAAAAREPIRLTDPHGHLRRGYGDLRQKLAGLGVDMRVT